MESGFWSFGAGHGMGACRTYTKDALMTQTLENNPAEVVIDSDIVAAVQRVLEGSAEPLTVSKIRTQLPPRFRTDNLEDILRRQAAANVLHQYPKYRSQQDRFWDRPMSVHIAALLRESLQDGALAWSELRRKLPAYAQGQAESILRDEVSGGRLHRHPRTGRGAERFGLQPPDARDYLREKLVELFRQMEQLGFTQAQLREGALELLHDEEWASLPAAATASTTAVEERPAAPAAPQTQAAEGAPPETQGSYPPHQGS
jgi:hypothetical protein